MTTAEINIRRAISSDAPELLELIRVAMVEYARKSGITTPLESQQETLDELLEHLRSDHVLVAVHRGRLIGTARLIHGEDDTAYFSRFAVLPTLHTSGVGRLIYRVAEDWLIRQGVRYVRLHTALTNKPLVRFYQARGFELIETKTARGYPRGLFQKILG